MSIAIATFGVSIIAIFFIIIRRVPDIANLPEEDDYSKDIICTAKEKIEEGVEKEVKQRFEDMLQITLSYLRRFFSRIERTTTKWLYTLKRRRKNKE